MKVCIKTLNSLDYASVKDIYRGEFCSKGLDFSTLREVWRDRERNFSLGAYNWQGDLLGFVLVEGNYISRIAVHSDFQSFGIGGKLLKKVLSKAFLEKRALHLIPLNWDEPLIKFYCRHGFYSTPSSYMAFHFQGTRRQTKFIKNYRPSI